MGENMPTEHDQEVPRQWFAQMEQRLQEAIQRFNATSKAEEMARRLSDPR